MATSAEDVLLQMSNVKHKKDEGTLCVMSERIVFCLLDQQETISVSHWYTDIKTQKVSSPEKPKVQLRLDLHDGSSTMFQFINPVKEDAMRDRDKIKNLLLKLLPKFQQQVNKELEEKNRILTENPALLQLYKDLVITRVITAEEFWQQHAPQKTNNVQNTGVPGNFLVNVKPQSDGCNAVKYNLSLETINCIFKTYPAVRLKHMENVPNKISEAEFWKKFFESHYFHKDRISCSSDIFNECAKIDDQDFKKTITSLNNDSIVNLNSIEDVDCVDGYGLSNDNIKTQNIAHENIIKRFNQHSINVLKASKASSSFFTAGTNGQINTNTNLSRKRNLSNGHCDDTPKSCRKTKIIEKITYEDFATANDNVSDGTCNLKLDKVEQFANDLTKSSLSEIKMQKLKIINIERKQMEKIIAPWSEGKVLMPLKSSAAVQALGDLTPGGTLMKGMLEDSQNVQLHPDVLRDLKNLYTAFGELSRHFWACFPPTTSQLEEKLIRTHEALRRFHSLKLKPFEDVVLRDHSHLSISHHLNIMLNSTYTKFSAWQCRKK